MSPPINASANAILHSFIPFTNSFSSGTRVVPPIRNDQIRDLWAPHYITRTFKALSFGTCIDSKSFNSLLISLDLHALPTTSSPTTTLKARLSQLFTWWPIHAGGAIRPIVDVPLAPTLHRSRCFRDDDDDLIRDEDATFPTPSPNPNSRPLAAGISTPDNMESTSCFSINSGDFS
ncbi:uncharacterized protein F5147DRAFT_817592 [Suillus discolor]|uniref:Uncharacterized protein n=1 Tax=Suillus discolor TaxID=1912936 RepID=A0A9P7FEB0_9AGAM|nr:uncharacterized protein F5147DRAFT_817592 [Suillus discolor]KAG2115851.1 hypothetical protein F5147DRAFT_817592 [Suillus discolor]